MFDKNLLKARQILDKITMAMHLSTLFFYYCQFGKHLNYSESAKKTSCIERMNDQAKGARY